MINRLKAESMKSDFIKELDMVGREQKYQNFLENNTEFLPRTFMQNHGIHCSTMIRKLSFGSDYTSDFFFFSKSSVDWHAVFIEIEKPQSKYFKGNGSDVSSDFTKAINQIKSWKSWLSEPANAAGFLSSMSNFMVPSHMAKNPTKFKFVLVHGRREEIEGNDIRRKLINSYQEDDFKIMSFDSLGEDLMGKRPLHIGVRHNEFIDIRGDEIIDGQMFSFIDPTYLRVSHELHKKLQGGSTGPRHIKTKNGNSVDAWVEASKTIRIRKY